jgi:pyruvate-formate lyase
MTDRIAKQKANTEAMMDAGVRKTTFYPLVAESLAMTEDEPAQIRRAKALVYLLDNVKLEVFPYELIGGSILGMWPVDPVQPTYEEVLERAETIIQNHINPPDDGTDFIPPGGGFFRRRTRERAKGTAPMMRARFALMARDHYDANVPYMMMQKAIKEMQERYADSDEITSQEIALVLEQNFQYDYGRDVMERIYTLPWSVANHLALNYERVINTGFGGILRQIEDYLEKTKDDPEKQEFYSCCKMAVEACIRYIKRYAAEYAKHADSEEDPQQAVWYREIAQVLDKVATEKPDTFREAIQLVWITHLIQNTQLGSALSFARFDQYMYPFYKKSLDKGEITFEEARNLVASMFLKINEPKMRTVQSMILAGVTPDGRDGANEFTRVVLAAAREVRLPYPNIALRVSKISPPWIMEEAIETIRLGFGMPQLVNEEHWVEKFMSLGHPEPIARQFYNMGCVENLIAFKHAGWLAVPNCFVSYPHMLDEILQEYKDGKYEFETFEELMDVMYDRIRTTIRSLKVGPDYKFMTLRGYDPLGSVLTDGCLEKGVDLFQGGAEVAGHCPVGGVGLATAVDSLSAIRHLVYEKKMLTLDELIDIVHNNYEGAEDLRQYILNNVPHYGNDDDSVDQLAVNLFNLLTKEVFDLNDGTIPEKYVSSFFSYTQSVSLGEVTGATPDGRKSGDPLSDGLGPAQGRDICGPTRLLASLLKLDYSYLTGALATNIKVNPTIFGTRGGIMAFKSMLETYLKKGGPQIQINFVRQEDLIDAQQNPWKHRNLVVRIAGFCEYFIYLDRNQQNEIIQRTAHEVA